MDTKEQEMLMAFAKALLEDATNLVNALSSDSSDDGDANEILTHAKSREKRDIPPTPPIEKRETCLTPSRAHEKIGKFLKPTVAEIRAYCEQRQNAIDAEEFFDFYESKNWMIGRSKMRNWRSAVRTWEKRRRHEADRETRLDLKMEAYREMRDAKLDAHRAEREAKLDATRKTIAESLARRRFKTADNVRYNEGETDYGF